MISFFVSRTYEHKVVVVVLMVVLILLVSCQVSYFVISIVIPDEGYVFDVITNKDIINVANCRFNAVFSEFLNKILIPSSNLHLHFHLHLSTFTAPHYHLHYRLHLHSSSSKSRIPEVLHNIDFRDSSHLVPRIRQIHYGNFELWVKNWTWTPLTWTNLWIMEGSKASWLRRLSELQDWKQFVRMWTLVWSLVVLVNW